MTTKNFVVKNGITTGNITLTASSGNIIGTNLSVTGISNLGAVGNVKITGGTTGQFITTDGSGNLSFGNATIEANPAPMPTYVAVGDELLIAANYQGLFGYPITIDGTMTVDGVLVDVNDNGNGGTGGTATALNANIANVSISGGSSGYYLQTDGSGTLTWAAGAGGNGSPGGTDTQVQFNDASAFGGNTGFTFNKTTGIFTAPYLAGNGNGLSNIQGANVSGAVGLATSATTAGTVTTAAQPNITSVGTLTSLAVNGNISANNANITGNIVPTSNNVYSLGSASSYWKDAFIGPGSLYINGVKVLEESSNAIVISADLNQTVKVTSSGSGDVQLQTTGTGVVAVKGPLQIQAANYITSSTGGPIGFSNPINVDTLSSLSANTNLTISANGTGNIQLNDDVTISGNLTINGGGGNLSVASLTVEDNIIDISAETTGTPINNAGIRVIRGDDPAVQLRWNETTDTWQTTNDGSAYLNIVGSNTTTGNANVGNIGATGGIFTTVAGALTTNAQPNITSTGILSSVSVSGNANVGNIGTAALVATGAGSFGANVNMNSQYINNLGYPSANTDAASKQYVDTMASSGISYHQPVNVATTTTLAVATGGTTAYNSPNGAANGIGAYISTTGTFLNIDGANVQTIGTRILVKDEANAAWNGVYTYSNTTAIVRSTDTDTYGVDLNGTDHLGINDYFFTLGGVVNEGTSFIVSAPTGEITFGTSNIVFSTFSTSQVYDAGTGLSLTGTTFNVNASQTQVTAVGTLASLSVSGNANVGNIGATNGVFTNVSGNGSALTSITGGNVTGQVSFAATANAVAGGNVSGQVTFAATANAVAGANVSGAVSFATTANAVAGANVSGAVSFATTANAVAGANVSGAVNLANYASTANAVALANVAGIGNIASLNINGNASTILYGNGVFAAAPVTYGNANVATFLASYGSNTITTTGNVSIGNLLVGTTTGSGYKMRIQDNALQLRLQTETNANLNVSLGYSYSGDYGQINCDESGVDQKDLWYTALNHRFGRNTSLQNMMLNSSGNLGIGTSSPNVKTEIVGGANTVETTLLQLNANAGGIGTGSTIAFCNSTNPTAGSGRVELAGIRETANGGSLTIRIGDNTGTIQNRVKINEDGNLGIGTTSPAQKLHVLSASTTATVAKFAATNYGNLGTTYIEIGTQNGDGGSRIGSINPTGNQSTLVFETMTSASGVYAERVRISNTGGFSVGTTADPGAGAITATGNITGGNLTTAGTMTAGTVTETSSIALKENFRPIENPLEKVLQLLGQIYDRKDGSSKDEAGLVAEDVYKIIPNLVKTDSNGNPESVFYSRLSVYLLESIKVLNDEIAILKGTAKNIKK